MCGHAIGEPDEYAAVAEARGLKGIVITCHYPLPSDWRRPRMTEEQLPEYIALVGRTREKWRGRLDVRLGLECEYAPVLESWLERQLARIEPDYLLASIHPIQRYQELYWTDDPCAAHRVYYEHLGAAAETGHFDAIAHFDFIKFMVRAEWDPGHFRHDIQRALDRIAAAGLTVELNTAGLRNRLKETYPSFWILKEMKKREIPVALASDAHQPEHVAWAFEKALDTLAKAGYTHVSFFLERRRQEIAIEQARASLT